MGKAACAFEVNHDLRWYFVDAACELGLKAFDPASIDSRTGGTRGPGSYSDQQLMAGRRSIRIRRALSLVGRTHYLDLRCCYLGAVDSPTDRSDVGVAAGLLNRLRLASLEDEAVLKAKLEAATKLATPKKAPESARVVAREALGVLEAFRDERKAEAVALARQAHDAYDEAQTAMTAEGRALREWRDQRARRRAQQQRSVALMRVAGRYGAAAAMADVLRSVGVGV